MSDVLMPRLSDSMEEGTILKWLKASGDQVSRGDELVEIETDKATMTYEADTDGVLEIVAAEGDTLPIGAVIARLGGSNGGPPAEAPDEAAVEVAATVEAPVALQGTPPVVAAPAPAVHTDGARVKASPVARRIARERGIDLGSVSGSGPGGRIVRADVEGSRPAPAPAPAPAAAPAAGADLLKAKGEVTVQELTKTQQVVARRMAASKATVPDFTLQAEIDMERCVELRSRLRELSDAPPSYNDMIVKACADALRSYPRANGAYKDERFELYSRVNVGVAVAAEDSLVVPTVFDADLKGLMQIAAETRALAERVRSGAITPPELSGGTFTVSNLGMFAISNFTAVINPPQAAILAVGAMTPRPVARDGEVVVRQTMAVTLACDHRILYGAEAAQFLGRIRELLEEPLAMLV
jgi:pyruvate dehydrogenase E2 component (dihydrolipoamide acetyltransferase)